jgi:hypothetical protein
MYVASPGRNVTRLFGLGFALTASAIHLRDSRHDDRRHPTTTNTLGWHERCPA